MAKTVGSRPPEDGRIRRIARGILSLAKGMGVTMGYFLRPSRVVTEQYPENRKTLKMTERFRGNLEMVHDAQGEHDCIACGMCERACPNASISVLPTKSLAGKKVLGQYLWRMDSCTLCGLCVEACPTNALRMGREFENATDDKKTLVRVLNRKEGRS